MPVDFGLLNQQMKSLMQGLQAAPWTFDPAQLTGDATQNRARVYSGSATDPRSPQLAPGSYAPGTPGVAPSSGLPTSSPQAAAPMSFQAPASVVAQSAPTQTASMPVPGQTTAPSPQNPASTDPNAPKDNYAGFEWFDPDVAKNAMKPEWQRQWNAANIGSNASGEQQEAGLGLYGQKAPTSKDGNWVMGGNGNLTFLPNQQPAQIPADLQALVTQFLSGKNGGAV